MAVVTLINQNSHVATVPRQSEHSIEEKPVALSASGNSAVTNRERRGDIPAMALQSGEAIRTDESFTLAKGQSSDFVLEGEEALLSARLDECGATPECMNADSIEPLIMQDKIDLSTPVYFDPPHMRGHQCDAG